MLGVPKPLARATQLTPAQLPAAPLPYRGAFWRSTAASRLSLPAASGLNLLGNDVGDGWPLFLVDELVDICLRAGDAGVIA